jgi:hypothetical protein
MSGSTPGDGDSENRAMLTLVHPEAYFQELVSKALGNQRVAAQPETEFYLVHLLNQFMCTDRLYHRNSEGEPKDEALVIMVKEALEQPQPHAQSLLFRHIGDVSLYTAGFFQASLTRKLVDVEYYIDMGGTAYQQVAARVEEDHRKMVYQELAEKFGSFVEVLAEVSDVTTPKTEKDLLRMYDLWVRTRSERAAKALQEAGILPNETVKKNWQ